MLQNVLVAVRRATGFRTARLGDFAAGIGFHWRNFQLLESMEIADECLFEKDAQLPHNGKNPQGACAFSAAHLIAGQRCDQRAAMIVQEF
jgi:hypothetical protein